MNALVTARSREMLKITSYLMVVCIKNSSNAGNFNLKAKQKKKTLTLGFALISLCTNSPANFTHIKLLPRLYWA